MSVAAPDRRKPASAGDSVVSRMAAALRHEIVVGAYPPGSELPSEARLLERFGVSRPSAREALRVLESEGLIRISRGARGGAKVLVPEWRRLASYVALSLQMREVRLRDLVEMLAVYEPMAVRAIAARRDLAALGELAQCVAAQEFCGDDRDVYNNQERRFRTLLISHSGNEVLHLTGLVLSEIFHQTLDVVRPSIPPLPWAAQHLASGVAAKQRLLKLMAAGDSENAQRLWRIYLRVYEKRLSSHIGKDAIVAVHSPFNPPADFRGAPLATEGGKSEKKPQKRGAKL